MNLVNAIKALFGYAKRNPDTTRALALEILAEIRAVAALLVSLVKSARTVRSDVNNRLENVRDKLGDVKEALEAEADAPAAADVAPGE